MEYPKVRAISIYCNYMVYSNQRPTINTQLNVSPNNNTPRCCTIITANTVHIIDHHSTPSVLIKDNLNYWKQYRHLIVNLVKRIYQDTIFVSPSSHHPTDLHIVVPHHNSDDRMTINIPQETLNHQKQRAKSCPQKENELSLEQYLNENAVLLLFLQPMQTIHYPGSSHK